MMFPNMRKWGTVLLRSGIGDMASRQFRNPSKRSLGEIPWFQRGQHVPFSAGNKVIMRWQSSSVFPHCIIAARIGCLYASPHDTHRFHSCGFPNTDPCAWCWNIKRGQVYSWPLLIFIFFNAFVFLNMMIGIVIGKMQEEGNLEQASEHAMEVQDTHNLLQEIRNRLDKI